MTTGISIAREAAISFVINALLSVVFFLGVFGLESRPLSWSAPDGLGLDFVPQSIAVALMSALVPSLIARRRLDHAPAVRTILLRGALFALIGAALGATLAFSIGGDRVRTIGWGAALIMKIAYGGFLGALVASVALRWLVSSTASASHKI